MSNFIPIKDSQLLKERNIPFKPSTLYKWHCIGKNPQLFRKVSGRLLLNLDEWKKLLQGGER